MQSGSKKLSVPVIAAGAVLLTACAAWFGYLSYHDRAEEQRIRDGEPVYYDYDFTDTFLNQSLGNCIHDLSYAEPEIPDGKYYPDGDESRGYYAEFTSENGKRYFEYKNADGSPYVPDGTQNSSRYLGKHEYAVKTVHHYDKVFVTTSWEPHSSENDPAPGMWQGEKIDFGNDPDGIRFEIFCNDDGSVEMEILYSGECNEPDIGIGYHLKMPQKNGSPLEAAQSERT